MPHHEAQSQLGYSREQAFELAADVESYPEFLPGWIAARILHRDGNVYHTEQLVGFGTFREHFRSRTVLERPERIRVSSNDGIFQRFDLQWLFDPLPDQRCRVAVQVDVEIRSRVAQLLFDRAISNMVGSILSAFEARAHRIYGASHVWRDGRM